MTRIDEAALKFFRKIFPASQIKISDLKKYLKDRGWSEESKYEYVTKFKSPKSIKADIYVMVPTSDDSIDYERVVEIVIEIVSSVENRNFEDVYKDILSK